MFEKILLLAVFIVWIIYFIRKMKIALHMLQQNLYNDDNRYNKWLKSQRYFSSMTFKLECWLLILLVLLNIFNATSWLKSIVTILSLMFFIKNINGEIHRAAAKQKKPLVVTNRVKRLIFTLGLITLIPIVLIILLGKMNSYLLIYLVFISMFTYHMMPLGVILNKGAEKSVYNKFKRQAVKKLNSMPNMKVVGITGSYGKTSNKNILSNILNITYNTIPTPKNFNTPYGLIMTINNHIDKFHEIFIAEMGAYKIGEIQELCDLVHPKYGILTKIGQCHLETFKSQQNIQKGKFELIESLPEDGVGVLNGDDELQVNYKLKNNCKILWYGIENQDVDVYAKNIVTSHKGTTFEVVFKGDKKAYKFETKLLGHNNVYNILSSLTLAYEFKIPVEKLQKAVSRVEPVEHRLELKKMGNINIIDDAYNSNPDGSKMACEVLKSMPGKHIIVTPGMIELGELQDELNEKFGEYIADSCDEVILVGEKQTAAIRKGLDKKKFAKKKIHIIDDVKKAFPLMKELKEGETYVLLENDLPDIFNE